MPELPEIEHLKRSLEPALLGSRVSSVRLLRADVIHPRCTSPAQLMAGQTIANLERRGKHLAILSTTGRALCIHLGMSGRLRFLSHRESRSLPPHTHCLWRIAFNRDRATLAFIDPRRFGGIWHFPSRDALLKERWESLGPDAATLTRDQLAAALNRCRAPVKAALLDQSRLAGLGNIYADEALFHARIHPQRPAGSLAPSDLDRLCESIRHILNLAINAGGSTLRDYIDANGNPGLAQQLHVAYGRAGLPCITCRQPLRAIAVAQRTTTYCPRCQPRCELRRGRVKNTHPSPLTSLPECAQPSAAAHKLHHKNELRLPSRPTSCLLR